jgi:hypothetical protein
MDNFLEGLEKNKKAQPGWLVFWTKFDPRN